MLDRLHGRMRTILAMCCMVSMTVLVAQGAIIGVDRSLHALGVDHAPTAMAGEVHYDHDEDHDPGHEAAAADHAPDDGDGAPAHHHYTEGPQLVVLAAERLPTIIVVRMAPPPVPHLDGSTLRVSARLERPPKTASTTIA